MAVDILAGICSPSNFGCVGLSSLILQKDPTRICGVLIIADRVPRKAIIILTACAAWYAARLDSGQPDAEVAGTQSAAHGIDSRAPPPSPAQGIMITNAKHYNAYLSKKTITWCYVAQLTRFEERGNQRLCRETEPRPIPQNLSEMISFVSILFRRSRFWLRPDIILRLK